MQTDPNWSNFFYNAESNQVRERGREGEGGEGKEEGERGR